MITIEKATGLLQINVFEELTISDYKEFEAAVADNLKSAERVDLLFDLRMMTGFSLDVAWEDIKFVRQHSHDFAKIAVITNDQWVSWASWINAAFMDATVEIFSDPDDARSWIEADQ